MLGNWVGNYGHLYLARAIIATNLLGANIPKQAIYPTDYQDIKGRNSTAPTLHAHLPARRTAPGRGPSGH